MRAVTLVLSFFTSLVSSRFHHFNHFACIGERAVRLKIYEAYQRAVEYDEAEIAGFDRKSELRCARSCNDFAFMFFLPQNRSETFNCICVRQKGFHKISNDTKKRLPPLKITPSDITSKPLSQECDSGYGYMLSCQETESSMEIHVSMPV